MVKEKRNRRKTQGTYKYTIKMYISIKWEIIIFSISELDRLDYNDWNDSKNKKERKKEQDT